MVSDIIKNALCRKTINTQNWMLEAYNDQDDCMIVRHGVDENGKWKLIIYGMEENFKTFLNRHLSEDQEHLVIYACIAL